MAKGKKTGGRVKGVPNKLTTDAKEVIAQVAANIGGVPRMTKWVRESPENERAFWTSIYTKLLPLQVAGDKDNPLSIHRIERTIVEHHASPALAPPTIDNEVMIERETSSAELPALKPKRHWSDD
jgi:hypothetical protein